MHLLIHNFRSSHQNTWSLLDTRICWFCLYTLWIVYKCRGEPDSCSYLSYHNSLLKYRTHFYIIRTSIGEILVSFASISIFLNVLYSYWLIYMYIIWNIPSSSCLKIGTYIVLFCFLYNEIIFYSTIIIILIYFWILKVLHSIFDKSKTIFFKFNKMIHTSEIIYLLSNILRLLVYNSEGQFKGGLQSHKIHS